MRMNQFGFCGFEAGDAVAGIRLVEGKEMGWEKTYCAATTIVLVEDMFTVNSAPMAMMSFLRYSRDSPV